MATAFLTLLRQGDKMPDFSIPLWKNETTERRERNKNRLTVVNSTRVTGLIGMLETAGERIYTTTNQIDDIKAEIDLYYEEIVENDTTGIVIPKIKQQLEKLKSQLDQVLQRKRQNAYAVTTITVERPYSAFLLAYELYGEYIRSEEQLTYIASIIKNLNKSLPAHKLQGEVRVIEIG